MMADYFSYLPQPDEPSAWQLNVLGAGRANIEPNQDYPPRNHPHGYSFDWERGRSLESFQVLFITHGSGVIETAHTPPQTMRAPFLFLLFPNVWHRYRPLPDTGWQEHWIGFDGPIPRQLLKSGVIRPDQPFFDAGHHDGILAQFQLVLDEVKNEPLGFRRITASAVLQVLAFATCLPIRNKEESQPMRAIARQACFLMRERVDTILSMEALAAELNVGYTYFRRMFKKYTGLSPKQYHTQLRLERVKRLLRESKLPIGDIADLLGFDSAFHLSQWFRKLTEVPPSVWRRKSGSVVAES